MLGVREDAAHTLRGLGGSWGNNQLKYLMRTLCCCFNLGVFLLFNYFPCFSFLDEGYYQGGKFQFETEVPDAYNMVVSICH